MIFDNPWGVGIATGLIKKKDLSKYEDHTCCCGSNKSRE